jgi:hypothetical protein
MSGVQTVDAPTPDAIGTSDRVPKYRRMSWVNDVDARFVLIVTGAPASKFTPPTNVDADARGIVGRVYDRGPFVVGPPIPDVPVAPMLPLMLLSVSVPSALCETVVSLLRIVFEDVPCAHVNSPEAVAPAPVTEHDTGSFRLVCDPTLRIDSCRRIRDVFAVTSCDSRVIVSRSIAPPVGVSQ